MRSVLNVIERPSNKASLLGARISAVEYSAEQLAATVDRSTSVRNAFRSESSICAGRGPTALAIVFGTLSVHGMNPSLTLQQLQQLSASNHHHRCPYVIFAGSFLSRALSISNFCPNCLFHFRLPYGSVQPDHIGV
jgi:hypothetical protein